MVSENYQIPKFKKVLNNIYRSHKVKFDKNIDLSELDRKLDSHKINISPELREPHSNHIKDFVSFYKYICILLGKKPSFLKSLFIIVLQKTFYFLKYIKYNLYIKMRYR